MKDNKKIRYLSYPRKSSDSEDRQVQSIENQINDLTKLAEDLGLEIIDILPEAKSAKQPGNRPVFDKMLERIEQDEADGILCWEINRLSRNPIDSGKIQWMLQQNIIKSIRTMNREYRPDDNALLLSVESGSANQFILDLKRGVKRGVDSKLKKGWMPGIAPLGYLNTKTEIRGENYIIKDPERFDLVRKGWDMLLTGNYTVAQVMRKMNDWGFRTRKWKKRGGKPLAKSTAYAMFSNIFYTGTILRKGEYFNGAHEVMITLEEFDRVQMMLGKKGKPRPNKYEYAYTGGLIICGGCGGIVSATYKEKLIKQTGKLQNYILYYCVCARKNKEKCPEQRHYTNVDEIEKIIEKEIMSLTILPEFKDWALSIIAEKNDEEITDRTKIYKTQQKAVNDTQKQIDNLTQMRLREMVDDNEYTRERTRLKKELATLQSKVRKTEKRAKDWLKLTEQTFEFACYAHKAFLFGDAQTKREILSTIVGLNCALKDHMLNIKAVEWLVRIENEYPPLKAKYDAFELENNKSPQRQKEAFASLSPVMRGRPDLNRRSTP